MKTNRFLVISFLYAAALFGAAEKPETDSMEIESGEAQYDGRKISLVGDVHIDHELGNITAEEVVLHADPDEKKPRFGAVAMRKNVKIHLRDGGDLSCGSAELDYKTMLGKFHSSMEDDFVSYWENCAAKGEPESLLNVKSREMEVLISRAESKTGESPRSSISRISAIKDVVVDYNNNFTAFADKGVYQRKDSEENNAILHRLPGTIILLMDDPKNFCKVVNKDGDSIQASKIDMDTRTRTIGFEVPKGTLSNSTIAFEADKMVWDDTANILTLSGNVFVDNSGMGKMSTDKEVLIYRSPENGKHPLRAIESHGKTTFTQEEKEKELRHTLICQGKVFLDHEKSIMTMDSPKDENGKIADGNQVFFHDQMGEIQANKAAVLYQIVDGEIVLSKIHLEGNVRILDRNADNPADDAPILHYALADAVEFNPNTKEMLFTAAKKKRVLFYDKVNNVQVSAPAIKFQRDSTSKKDSIKGIGDVRLNFVESEFEQLRQRFSLGEGVHKKP